MLDGWLRSCSNREINFTRCVDAQRRKRKREAAGGGGDKGSGGTVRGTGRDEFLPGGPKYCRFLLCKENMDSGHALSLLARTVHCSPSCFGVAGTKDKRAVTVQQVTAFKVTLPVVTLSCL